MDPMENNKIMDNNNSEEQQSQEAESGLMPSLSQVKKSWGFRRTTIARREFMDEVGDLAHSPPIVRRGKGRRSNHMPTDVPPTQRTTRATKSVIDELEWSAPSSPASEEGKPASDASASVGFDPSLWQDFGSAFQTAFSLLGDTEGLATDVSDALVVPDVSDTTEAPASQTIDEPEVQDNVESVDDDTEISQPVPMENMAEQEISDVVLISSQEEDSDEMTLLQIKEHLASKGRQGERGAKGGKGGRGKAKGRGRGRGRGRGKGRGRGRGRGKAAELPLNIAEDEDDDVVFVEPAEQGLQQLEEVEKVADSNSPAEVEMSPGQYDTNLSPPQQSGSDCIYIDSDLDQVTDVIPGQYDDAPEEQEEKEKMDECIKEGEYSDASHAKGFDSDAVYCICRQKQNDRFMICCDSCQEWFHGSCVGISDTQGREMERRGQEYICPTCTTKNQSHLQPEPEPQPELDFPECLTQNTPAEEEECLAEQQAIKDTVMVVEEEEEEKVVKPEPGPEAEMETDSSLPLCIGPGCSKQALPDSVYCGRDCILQHAAFTMKTLSDPKMPKTRGRVQRKAAATKPTDKGQRSLRMSARLAEKQEKEEAEEEEEEVKEGGGVQKEAASPLACNPSLTEAQPSSLPPSKFYTASKTDSKQVEAYTQDVTPSNQSSEETSTDPGPLSHSAAEPDPPQENSQEKQEEPVNNGDAPQQKPEELNPTPLPNSEKSVLPVTQYPSTSAPRHHETGALIVSKTTYVIPKKQSAPQSPSSLIAASASGHKPPPVPTLLNETRNLLVPPAPSAPSSRPSQPNTQVRQSIQRSLTSILFKRVCDCKDLEMSESDVVKLVASIEMEMFDIFRNTDSKYMNKYRTIMFNLKDPKNKGLLYQVVRGEIRPFRLVRMSQKDMQAIKVSEPNPEEATQVKDAVAKAATSALPKPEAVKVDLPSLNLLRPDKSAEQKRSFPASAPAPAPASVPAPVPAPAPAPGAGSGPAPKMKSSQPIQNNAVPDILTCMLKDTTSEHKSHLFDLKCKICTGQIPAGDQEEPLKKKPKVSERRDKYESSWRKSQGDDSPLRAPPDSPDMDSPTSSLADATCRYINDSPVLTIVESPASPMKESPASPTVESPASPVMESPASPTSDTPDASTVKRAYAPVVIPAVSTVTITRRDPRTAARLSAPSSGTSGSSSTIQKPSVPYAPLKETRLTPPLAPVSSVTSTKPLPKSILMKPTSSADPRLYGASSRAILSESPAEDETTQFLAKQDIVWKGFLNMLTVAKFVTKGYLVSGSAEILKEDLPDTIQIGGRILPETVWDYVEKLKTSVTKELCVIRFHPATEEEEVAYVSLFSYFSSRRRFGVVSNSTRSIKDLYLVPLSAKESVPSILHPLEGPGLENKRPNLLLGLAIIQKVKRPGGLTQEIEEKRPKVHMPKDPLWIPKPPVLYGSDKLEIFQPYDPETPANTSLPGSPSCPGSPSESPSSGSVTESSLLSRKNSSSSNSATVVATETISSSGPEKNPSAASSDAAPLKTILHSLFHNKQADSVSSSSSAIKCSVKKIPALSQGSGSMVDPIVQQYGQKSKVKEIEEEQNDFDRPYDPEEEYDPAIGYEMPAPQKKEKIITDPAKSDFVDDDVAYDPEDETIFADIQGDTVPKASVPTQMSDTLSCPTPASTQNATSTSSPVQTSSTTGVKQNLPTDTVVVSAATLTEQQRMLEELNRQIEEQKRQLKEQEEALRQQRETVGMFMAHFSVSDSLMSPPSKALSPSQLSLLQSGALQTQPKSSESASKTSNLTIIVDSSNVEQPVQPENTSVIPNSENNTDIVTEPDEIPENLKESEKYSSAGEIEDSDVAYDPEDETLFDEIQDDVFQGSSAKSRDSSLSRTGHSGSRKGTSHNSRHSRKRRFSPTKRSHRERDHHRSPSRKSQRHSPSHSLRRRERDRHRRSERDKSRHRARDQSERQSRHRKEHASRRHSRGRRRSPSSPRKTLSSSLSPKHHGGPSSPVLEDSSTTVTISNEPGEHEVKCNPESIQEDTSDFSQQLLHNVKQEHDQTLVSDHEAAECKLSQQESLIHSKIENTVPLREIDPPIRDSPQSPDPEPQFAKPCSIDQIDKTEELKDTETYTSALIPLVKEQGNCLPMSNMVWPKVEGPMSNVDFRALHLQSQYATDQSITDKQKEENPGLSQSKIQSQQSAPSNSTTTTDIHGSVLTLPGSTDQLPGMKEYGIRVSQTYPRETGIRFPGPDMRGLGFQGSPTSLLSVPNIPDPERASSEKNIKNSSMLGVNMVEKRQGPFVRNSETDVKGQMQPGLHCPGPDMNGPAVVNKRINQDACVQKGILPIPQPENPNININNPQFDYRAPDIIERGRDQGGRASPHPACMNSSVMGITLGNSNPDGRIPCPSFTTVLNKGGTGLEFKTPEPLSTDSRGPMNQNNDPGPHTNNPNWNSQGSDEWCRPNMTGSSPVLGGPPIQGEWRHLPNRRDQNMEHLGVDHRGPGHPNFMEPGYEINSFDMEVPVPCRKGPGGPDFSRPESERFSTADDFRPIMKGPECPNFVGPDFERRCLPMDGPGLPRRGRGGRNFRGPGPEIRGQGGADFRRTGPEGGNPTMETQNPNRRQGGHPNFCGPAPERRGPDMGGPGPDIRQPGGPDFRGPRSDWKGSPVSGPGPDWRGPSPDFTGLRPDMRSHGGPDFRETGSDMRGPTMETQGPERRQFGDPNFSGQVPERRGPPMDCPGPERNRHAYPDLRGPVPHMIGQQGPEFRGHGPESRGLSMEGCGPDLRGPGFRDLRKQGLEVRSPVMEVQRPDRRESGVSDFRGPHDLEFQGQSSEWRGPSMHGPGPDRRGPGDPATGGLGPDNKGPLARGLRPGQTGSDVEAPAVHYRGQGGPHFPGSRPIALQENPRPDSRGPDCGGQRFRTGPDSFMEQPRSHRRGPGGPNMGRPRFQNPDPNMECHEPDKRALEYSIFSGPGSDRLSNTEGTDNDREYTGGTQFMGHRPERMNYSGPGRIGTEGSDFGEAPVERRKLGIEDQGHDRPDRTGSGFREPMCEKSGSGMQNPRMDWGRSVDPDLRGRGIRHSGPITGSQGHRDDSGGVEFSRPQPIQENPGTDFSNSDRTSENLRGPRLMRRNMHGPGPNMSNLNQEGRRGLNMEIGENEKDYTIDNWHRHGNRVPGAIHQSPDEQAQDNNRQGPSRGWRGPEKRGAEPIRERSNMQGPFRGQINDWTGYDCRGTGPVQDDPNKIHPGPDRGQPGAEWRRSDRGSADPNKSGPGSFFSDNVGQGHDNQGPGMRRPRAGMRERMGHDMRQPDFRSNMRGQNMDGPETLRGGGNRGHFDNERIDSRYPERRCHGPENRNTSDGQETDRQGFENLRRERGDPHLRRQGPDKRDVRDMASERSDIRHGPGRWNPSKECTAFNSKGSEIGFRGPSEQVPKPQRQRVALLPTPTEGLIRFPNRATNNPNIFSPIQKQLCHQRDRNFSPGRPVSKERELGKGQRQTPERSLAGNIGTPVNEGRRSAQTTREDNEQGNCGT